MTPLTLFKALSDETRLKSIMIIQTHGEACVCDLMSALALDQPKVSRHLAELRKNGILQDERRGKWVYYQLHPSLPDWAKSLIKETAEHNLSYFSDSLSTFTTSEPNNHCD